MKVAILTASHNRPDLVLQLAGWVQRNVRVDCELDLVEAGTAPANLTPFTTIQNPDAGFRGEVFSQNLALEHAREQGRFGLPYDAYVVLRNDVVFDEAFDAVGALVEALAADPRLAIVGGSPDEGLAVLSAEHAERARIRNREIGFIFQSFNLIGDLTVLENVELPLTYRGLAAADRKQRALESLEKVGMSHRLRHFPGQLSGGQQQRVAVARALAGKPSILLADEPTGNLDSKNGEAVMNLLRQLHREGATLCMVTHDPRFARHADRQIHLFDGRIVQEHHE